MEQVGAGAHSQTQHTTYHFILWNGTQVKNVHKLSLNSIINLKHYWLHYKSSRIYNQPHVHHHPCIILLLPIRKEIRENIRQDVMP